MAAADPEISSPSDTLNKLSQALVLVSRGDPLVSLRAELATQFGAAHARITSVTEAVETRFDAIDKATELQHEDQVRVPTQIQLAVAAVRDVLELSIRGSRELIFAEIDKTRQVSTERLARVDTVFADHATAIDAALKADQKSSADQMSILRSEIEKLAAVSLERFAGIDTMFVEIEKRTNQLSVADKTAVAAALQAAKEAVGAQNTSNSVAIAKSESSTLESIKQLGAQFTSAIASLDEKVNDVKSRLDRGEGKTSATDPQLMATLSQMSAAIVDLKTSRDAGEGKTRGADSLWGYIVGGIGVLVGVVGFIELLTRTAVH